MNEISRVSQDLHLGFVPVYNPSHGFDAFLLPADFPRTLIL